MAGPVTSSPGPPLVATRWSCGSSTTAPASPWIGPSRCSPFQRRGDRKYFHFAIAERDDVEGAVRLALIGLAVTEIALWGRRQQARGSTRAGYLRGVVF